MSTGTQFFVVTIYEFVGDLEFPHRTLCSGPDELSVENAVHEGMRTFRGEGEEGEEGLWDYGETLGRFEHIEQIPNALAGEILERGILPHWIEL